MNLFEEDPPPAVTKPAPKPPETYPTLFDWVRCKVRDRNLNLTRNGIRDYVNREDGLNLIELGVGLGWIDRPTDLGFLTHLFDGPAWESLDDEQTRWRYVGA